MPAAAQVEYMAQVREAFMSEDTMTVLMALVAEPLAACPRMREQDVLLVQLVVTFLRNLLCIPDGTATAGP